MPAGIPLLPWVFAFTYTDHGFVHYVMCSFLYGVPVVYMSTIRPSDPQQRWCGSGWHGNWCTTLTPLGAWIWVRLNYRGRNDRLRRHVFDMSRGRIVFIGNDFRALEFDVQQDDYFFC